MVRPLDLARLYQDLSSITLHPGSLHELNMIESLSNTGRQFKPMSLLGDKKYLTGIIIPTEEEDNELIKAQHYRLEGLIEIGLDAILKNVDVQTQEESDVMSSILAEDQNMASQARSRKLLDPNFAALDIRMKAKKMGARGLIHFQLYNNKNIYMGVPVRLAGDSYRGSIDSVG